MALVCGQPQLPQRAGCAGYFCIIFCVPCFALMIYLVLRFSYLGFIALFLKWYARARQLESATFSRVSLRAPLY